jgi:integrase
MCAVCGKTAHGRSLCSKTVRKKRQDYEDVACEYRSKTLVSCVPYDGAVCFVGNLLRGPYLQDGYSDGVVRFNPAMVLFSPARKAQEEKRVMTPEGIRLALGVLGARERLIFRMAVFDGMRPGEILAVRLGSTSLYSILIDRRVYKGDIDSPKRAEGKAKHPLRRTIAGHARGTRDLANASTEAGPGRLLVRDETKHTSKPGQLYATARCVPN